MAAPRKKHAKRKGPAGAAARRRASRPTGRKTGKKKVAKVMGEFKRGTLASSSGAKVRKRTQAVAIALSEARQSGARIPRKPSGGRSR